MRYLNLNEVLDLYRLIMEQSGGRGGIHNLNALESALAQPHSSISDVTGRLMKGMVMVAPEGVAADEGLAGWVGKGVAFAVSLPAK